MSDRQPRLGDAVVYRPRVPYGRQSEITGLITRVDPHTGAVNIVTFPDNSETQHMSNVARASDKVLIHCWEFVDDPVLIMLEVLEKEMAELRRDLDTLLPNKAKQKRERDLVS